MTVYFQGITHIQGPQAKVEAQKDKASGKGLSVSASLSEYGQSRAIVLDKKDATQFLESNYNLTAPDWFQNQSGLRTLISLLNKKKRAELVTFMRELQRATHDFNGGFISKMFAYYDAQKAEGKDASGRPIKEKVVS